MRVILSSPFARVRSLGQRLWSERRQETIAVLLGVTVGIEAGYVMLALLSRAPGGDTPPDIPSVLVALMPFFEGVLIQCRQRLKLTLLSLTLGILAAHACLIVATTIAMANLAAGNSAVGSAGNVMQGVAFFFGGTVYGIGIGYLVSFLVRAALGWLPIIWFALSLAEGSPETCPS